MVAPALPDAERLAGALTAMRSIAQAVTIVVIDHGVDRLKKSAGRLILADWNDSNDPASLSSDMDGWRGVIKCRGFRLCLSSHSDHDVKLGLYRPGTEDDPLGAPITLDTICD